MGAHSGNLRTIADIPRTEIAESTTGGMYGPLWGDTRQVVEETNARFSASDWQTLYTPGPQRVKTGHSYPATPYTTPAHIQAPVGGTGVENRRVLNVPLLNCPVSAP